MATVTRSSFLGKAAAVLLGLAAVVCCFSCGRQELPKGRVTGRVTYQGKPLKGWIIYFVPERGPVASGLIDEEGRYSLSTTGSGDGAVVGRHKVYFSPPPSTEAPADLTKPESPIPPRRSGSAISLPPKLCSPASTDKTAEVKPGSQQIDFDL